MSALVRKYVSPSALVTSQAAQDAALANQALAANGAGQVGLAHALTPPEGTVAAAALQKVQAFNHLSVSQKAEARSGVNTLVMSTEVQAALNARPEVDFGSAFSYLATGLTVPTTARAVYGAGTVKCATNGTTLMQWPADTTRQAVRRFGGGLKLDANGKTGCTGVRFGSVTNNPSAGAQEAILYVQTNDLMVRGFDTGVRHDVSMEHVMTNLAVVANTVGMKVYSDVVNGGGNANTWVGFRANSNQVGAMVVNQAAYPIQHNGFYGGTIQENTLCGMYFRGFGASGTISAIKIDNMHFEANAIGAPASAVIDGYTVLKSQMHLDTYASVNLTDSSINTSIEPAIVLRNNSTLYANNVTGFGNPGGVVYDVDSTSKVYESGVGVGTGIKYLESYGYFDAAAGLSLCTVIGAPVIELGNYPNQSPLPSNVVPTLNNVVGATAGSATDETYGEVSTLAFLASAGNTGANRSYWAGANGAAGDYAIMSFLVKASANTSVTFRFTDSTNLAPVAVSLRAGQWRRVLHVMKLVTGTALQVYIYPNDSVGAVLSFKGMENCNSSDLAVINAIYQYGWVGDGGTGVRTIASAAAMTLTPVPEEPYAAFLVSGTTGITSIVPTGWASKCVTLIFQGALTVTDGSNLKLAGNFVTTGDDTLTLTCDGTNWYEVGRAVN